MINAEGYYQHGKCGVSVVGVVAVLDSVGETDMESCDLRHYRLWSSGKYTDITCGLD